MANASDRQMAVARIYGNAMLDLAESRGVADELRDELVFLAQAMAENRGLADFLASPLVDSDERALAIERMFRDRLSDTLVDSLQVIHRKGRLGLLPVISEAYREGLRVRRGRVEVRVKTAVEIDAKLRDKIHAAMTRYCDREPDLYLEVDPAQVGGIVLQVGDHKVDASVLNEIRKLRQVLVARTAQELLSQHRIVQE